MRWISGCITQLLQVTHTQWIYQCASIHDRTTGMLISAHKEELLKEIEHQLSLGPESLAEEGRFLLECNFDNITTSTREHQEYWVLHPSRQRGVTHLHGNNDYAATTTQHQYHAETVIDLILYLV
jgi:hypothetical protein